jgi:8-amino-7-oxononanoate synthase
MSESELYKSARNDLDITNHRGLLRSAPILQSRDNNIVTINGQRLINFSSNDYLGLASHPRILEAVTNCSRKLGFGSAASPLVCGKTEIHEKLEHLLAGNTGRDRAVLFTSGYQANLGLISAISRLPDMELFVDRFCHASIIDGILLSRVKFRRYEHIDDAALAAMLKSSKKKLKLIVTEAIFSMDGDICPLPQFSKVVDEFSAKLIVDDAHGFGVLGSGVSGTLASFNIGQESAPLMSGTFGKALGLQGAFIAGENSLIELLVQNARPYIYSTAMSAPLAAGVIESMNIIKEEPERKQHLFKLINYFQSNLSPAGLSSQNTNTPIQPFIVGDPVKVMRICEQLREKGLFVVGIRPPTVPENTSRIRISINANHNFNELDLLIDALAAILKD